MRALIVLCGLLTGCAASSQPAPQAPAQHASCIMAGATKIIARDVDPVVPLVGHADGGTLTIVYESTRHGRTAIDLDSEDLSVLRTRLVDPEPPESTVNGPVRLLDSLHPAIAFISERNGYAVLDVAPLDCL